MLLFVYFKIFWVCKWKVTHAVTKLIGFVLSVLLYLTYLQISKFRGYQRDKSLKIWENLYIDLKPKLLDYNRLYEEKNGKYNGMFLKIHKVSK